MILEKLWQDISFIYESLNYSSKLLVHDLMITSFDNRYELCYMPYGSEDMDKMISIHIKIYKNYNLVSMWSDGLDDITYNLYVCVSNNGATNEIQYELTEIEKIEFVYNIIRVYLREAKLKEVGI